MNFAPARLPGADADPRREWACARRARRRTGAHADDRRAAARTPMPRTARRQAGNSTARRRTRARRIGVERSTPRRQSDMPWLLRAEQRRRKPGAPEHATVPDLNFCIALQGIFPRRTEEASTWHNLMSARSGCSRETSLLPVGCSARASCCRFPRMTTLFNLIGTTYGGDGQSNVRLARSPRSCPGPPGKRYHPRPRPVARRRSRSRERRCPRTRTRSWRPPAPAVPTRPVNNVLAQSTASTILPYGTDQPLGDAWRARHRPGRRQPAALQLPAVPVRQLHHLAVRDLPEPDLGGRPMADPFVAEIRIFPFNFAPEGLGVLQWAAPAAFAEHRAVLAARHHLRRRRQVQLRAARTCRARAPMHPGQGPGLSLHDLGETSGIRDRHAAPDRDPVAPACAERIERRTGTEPSPDDQLARDRSSAIRLQTPGLLPARPCPDRRGASRWRPAA